MFTVIWCITKTVHGFSVRSISKIRRAVYHDPRRQNQTLISHYHGLQLVSVEESGNPWNRFLFMNST